MPSRKRVRAVKESDREERENAHANAQNQIVEEGIDKARRRSEGEAVYVLSVECNALFVEYRPDWGEAPSTDFRLGSIVRIPVNLSAETYADEFVRVGLHEEVVESLGPHLRPGRTVRLVRLHEHAVECKVIRNDAAVVPLLGPPPSSEGTVVVETFDFPNPNISAHPASRPYFQKTAAAMLCLVVARGGSAYTPPLAPDGVSLNPDAVRVDRDHPSGSCGIYAEMKQRQNGDWYIAKFGFTMDFPERLSDYPDGTIMLVVVDIEQLPFDVDVALGLLLDDGIRAMSNDPLVLASIKRFWKDTFLEHGGDRTGGRKVVTGKLLEAALQRKHNLACILECAQRDDNFLYGLKGKVIEALHKVGNVLPILSALVESISAMSWPPAPFRDALRRIVEDYLYLTPVAQDYIGADRRFDPYPKPANEHATTHSERYSKDYTRKQDREALANVQNHLLATSQSGAEGCVNQLDTNSHMCRQMRMDIVELVQQYDLTETANLFGGQIRLFRNRNALLNLHQPVSNSGDTQEHVSLNNTAMGCLVVETLRRINLTAKGETTFGPMLAIEASSAQRAMQEGMGLGPLNRGIVAKEYLTPKELNEESASTESEHAKLSELASKLRVRASDLRQNRDALFRRRVDNLANSGSGQTGDDSLDGYVKGSFDGSGGNDDKGNKRSKEEKMMERLIETPPWMPSQLAAFAATSPVDVELKHWKMLKTDLLGDSDFVCTSWDSTDVAAVYRGRFPRKPASSRSPEEADDGEEQSPNDIISITAVFEDLQARLEKHVELKDRIRLFLVDDNEWRPSFDTSGSYGTRMGDWRDTEVEGPPPVIVALASEVEPEQESERGVGTKSLAAFSSLLTVCTTFAYALSAFALNPAFFNAVVKENDVTPVPLCLPIFFGVLALSALHEAGHFLAAKKHKIKLGSPVPLPSLQVGSFGSITPLRSFPLSRAALFDVAISGPGIAMLVSLALIVSGLKLTLGAQSLAAFPVVPAALMKSSFLIGSIVSVVAPKMMLGPLNQPIPVHPIFFVGLAGIVMSAVNLLPIGRLDGGRASMAAWGRRMASLVSFLSLLILAFFSFSGTSGIIIFWGALVVMTQRLPDIPCVDEVTGVGDVRVNSYLLLLALSTLTLAPFPNGVGSI